VKEAGDMAAIVSSVNSSNFLPQFTNVPQKEWCPCPGRLRLVIPRKDVGQKSRSVAQGRNKGFHPRSASGYVTGPVHKSEVLKKDRLRLGRRKSRPLTESKCSRVSEIRILLLQLSCRAGADWAAFWWIIGRGFTMDLSKQKSDRFGDWNLVAQRFDLLVRGHQAQVQTRRQQPCRVSHKMRRHRVTNLRESFFACGIGERVRNGPNCAQTPDWRSGWCKLSGWYQTYKQGFHIRTRIQETDKEDSWVFGREEPHLVLDLSAEGWITSPKDEVWMGNYTILQASRSHSVLLCHHFAGRAAAKVFINGTRDFFMNNSII